MLRGLSTGRRPRGPALAAGSLVATASALVVVLQTARVAALYDLSFVQNVAVAIAQGSVPYRDFPLPYPPLTFVVQSLLVRAFGPHYLVSQAYAVVLDGAAAGLAFAIVLRVVGDVRHALYVALPLAFLGVHDVFPHPFYDADVTFLMLAAVAVALHAFDDGRARWWVATGLLLPLATVTKQNVGPVFLVVLLAAIVVALRATRRERALGPLLAGLAASALALALWLQLTAGLDHVLEWTVGFAARTRLATAQTPIAWLVQPAGLASVALALVALRIARQRADAPARAVAAVALLVPFAAAAALALTLVDGTAVLALWPLGALAGLLAGAHAVARGRVDLAAFLPFVVTGVAMAAFVSQNLAGSSYALWPLLALAYAVAVREAAGSALGPVLSRAVLPAAAALALVAGAVYSLGEFRLSFLRLGGEVARSTTPALAGLSAPGPYVPALDAALAEVSRLVPPDDVIVAVPGEDPLYFALGRRVVFPVIQFDVTTEPYDAAELRRLRDASAVRWVLVKRELQITVRIPELAARTAALVDGFDLVSEVGPYRLYRRP